MAETSTRRVRTASECRKSNSKMAYRSVESCAVFVTECMKHLFAASARFTIASFSIFDDYLRFAKGQQNLQFLNIEPYFIPMKPDTSKLSAHAPCVATAFTSWPAGDGVQPALLMRFLHLALRLTSSLEETTRRRREKPHFSLTAVAPPGITKGSVKRQGMLRPNAELAS